MLKRRARDWYNQANSDLSFAREGLNSGFYSQVCFLCQQSAEKAIKAIAFNREYEIRGHSIAAVAKQIGVNGPVLESAKKLDIYYISARYPDALPLGAPFEMFTLEQARNAISDASIILDVALAEFHDDSH